MAEIRVEQKRRSLAWLWILLALAIAALAFWYFNNDGVNQVDATQTGMVPAAPTLLASASVAPAPLAPAA